MTAIYCIENTVNHKKYVGLTKDVSERWRHHKHDLRRGTHVNKHLQSAWNKYGENAFKFYILEEVPEADLREAEIAWIKKLDAFHSGYNKTAGGDGQRERFLTDAERKHLSEINLGERNPNYGLKRSAETKRKMSDAMKGKQHGPMSEAHRQAISRGNKGKPRPWHNRPVIWIETGQTFPSISTASEQTGYAIDGISKVCRGVRNSLYNQHFAFLEE